MKLKTFNMKRTFFIVLELLIFALQLAFSAAEVESTSDIPTSGNLDQNLNAQSVIYTSIQDLKYLFHEHMNLDEILNNQTQMHLVPKPIPDVVTKINSFEEIISLRESLKNSNNKECTLLLNEKILRYPGELEKKVETDFDNLNKELKHKLKTIKESLLKMLADVASLYDNEKAKKFTENCTKNSETCRLIDEVQRNDVNNNIYEVGRVLNSMEEDFKNEAEKWITNEVNEKIIPSIKECLNDE